MEFFKIRKDIPFMRYALVFNIISVVTFLLAVFFLITRGLHLSIEFTGGTVMEVSYDKAAEVDRIRATLEKAGFAEPQVQNFGSSRDVLIRLPLKAGQSSADLSRQVMEKLKADDPVAELRRVEFVGPQVGTGAGRERRARTARDLARDRRLPRAPLRMEVRRRRDHRQPPRRGHHPGVLRLLPVGVLARGARGGAGGARLLGERVGGDRRPDPRELPQDAQGHASSRSSTTRSPARCRARSSPTAARR